MALNKWDNLFTLQIFTECWLSAYTTLSPKHVHIIFTSTHMGKHYHTHPCRSVYILMHVHVYHSLLMYTYKHMEYKEGYTFHILRSSEIGYTLLMIKDPRQHWQKVNLVFSFQFCALATGILATRQLWFLPLTDRPGPQRGSEPEPLTLNTRNHFFRYLGFRQKISKLIPAPVRSLLLPLPSALMLICGPSYWFGWLLGTHSQNQKQMKLKEERCR